MIKKGDNMKRICSYCKIYMGEKEPILVQVYTHGICKRCYKKQLVAIENLKKGDKIK